MKTKSLIPPFLLAVIATVFFPIFFPHLRLITFAPFLAIFYLRKPFYSALLCAILLGILLDLLSSHVRFGTHALAYACATPILYTQRIHFFEDRPLSFCCFSTFISAMVTLSEILLLSILSKRFTFSFSTFLTDILVLPFADGLYAFLWFTCPSWIAIFVKKVLYKTFKLRTRMR